MVLCYTEFVLLQWDSASAGEFTVCSRKKNLSKKCTLSYLLHHAGSHMHKNLCFFFIAFEMGKRQQQDIIMGKEFRKRRESLGLLIQIGSGELIMSEDGRCPVIIRLQQDRNSKKERRH